MAQRRMFSLSVVDTDAFLDMSASAQALYFHLGMRADDDGFVDSPRKITSMANCSTDDLKLLVTKGFVIPFESGVCVIRDWKVNNYLRNDRYTGTRYLTEKSALKVEENGAYSKTDTVGIPNVNRMVDNRYTQVSIGKVSTDKESIGESDDLEDKPPRKRTPTSTPPSVDEVAAYCAERNNSIDAQRFCDYYTQGGWKLKGGNPMRDWQAAVRTWERNGFHAKDGERQAKPDYNDPDKYKNDVWRLSK